MAFVRLLKDLMKDPEIGDRFAPIIPDEARTFGMDSLFPTAKIYDPHGQTYEAVDRNLLLSYKESDRGQILHEGISEAGAMASTTAAGTSYATHGTHMIPVYIFYSMFGFQRTGDQMWALGDQLGRGFLLGATAGRTTLTGEGLQHNDGHSVLLASVSPACVSYDAAWAYELAYIVKDALRRMYGSTAEHPDGEDIFYYLTVYNEPYVQPAEPADYEGGSAALERAILRGLYRYSRRPAGAARRAAAPPRTASTTGEHPQAQILASGVGLRWALDAQRLLADDWGVRAGRGRRHPGPSCGARRCTARNGTCSSRRPSTRSPTSPERWTGTPARSSRSATGSAPSPTRSPAGCRRRSPRSAPTAGASPTPGPAARRFFHVDAESITVAVLAELARLGEVKPEVVAQAIAKYRLDLAVSEAL